jgi:hypothetical protein
VAAEEGARLSHLWVRDRAEDRQFHRPGRGDKKIRDVEARAHGLARRQELADALSEQDRERDQLEPSLDELRSLGVIVVLQGTDATYPLRVDSLERMSRHRREPKRPLWLLLSVTPATDDLPERAMVWVSDRYRARFLKLFEDYLERTTAAGNPMNRELVANIGRIRSAVLADLWQSAGAPPAQGTRWWELWLHPAADAVELLRAYADVRGARLAGRVLRLPDRTVAWIEASWDQLQALPFTVVPLAEIRAPEFIDTIEDLPREEQDEFTEEFATRTTPPDREAPAVCHLDTGVRRTHVLLIHSLAEADMHSIVGSSAAAVVHNHGTLMAGLSLYGSLDDLLLGTATVALRHRLESVKFLPDSGPGHDPMAYGVATAESVAMPEVTARDRSRVFCMPVTTAPDRPGEPTLWSASVDALAAGVDIGRAAGGIELLSAPNPAAARLFVISAGNVNPGDFQPDYRAACDSAPIEDPAHAWNALTVGAYTDLVQTPSDPSFADWTSLAAAGDISPHSRTSVFFGRAWPIKPDICMEGGNVLTDGVSDFHEAHPLLSLRSTDTRNDLALASANATSAATAQAARLAALARASYPAYWPETIRGLMTHAAEWTSPMRAEIDGAAGRAGKLTMLRRYGWGVPSEQAVLTSARNAVTLVAQDEFVPFQGAEFAVRVFRLHQLPWPAETLRELGATEVALRVTLSYFVEPTASRRGWRRRYAYPSHGLRFELKAPAETLDDFVRRVNREAQTEEEGGAVRPTGRPERWLIGAYQRNLGSLHQDIWVGTGADLAASGVIAVHPIGGWWKNAQRKDRVDMPVRYALIVSLRTAEQAVDLYTPIAIELQVPVETAIPGT